MSKKTVIAIVVVAGIGFAWMTFDASHQILPEPTCTQCHGPGILQQNVMRTEVGDPFTGSDACEPCHSNIYHRWSRSDHCRTMMCPGPTTVFSQFSPDTAHYEYQGFTTKMVSTTAGYEMIAPDEDGVDRAWPVDLVIGIRDHQGFLTRFPDGRYQVLPSTYDMRKQTWFDATEGLVVSDHVLRPDDEYYWTSRMRSWNRGCFDCHLSGMRKNYDAETNTYATTWRDLGVDCEACHGAGLTHARLRTIKHNRSTLAEDTSLVRLQDLSPRQQVEVCGQCHARKATLAEGYTPGADFHEHYFLYLLDDNMVMPDGRFWGMMYLVLALMQSPCFEHGGITCTHCHDAHGSGLRNDIYAHFEHDNEMCLPCHADKVDDPRSHTHHTKPEEGGMTCRNCHMMEIPASHMEIADHTISIPVPENTIAFNSPNACTNCHPDSTNEWAVLRISEWHGSARRDRWTRADVLYRAKSMDTSAVLPLIKMLDDTSENLIWRANAAFMLGGMGDTRAVRPLLAHIDEPDPLIRHHVIQALTHFNDPGIGVAMARHIRAETNSQIRVLIAGKLGWWWRSDLSPDERRIAQETWDQYIRQVNSVLSDWPEARVDLGNALLKRGEIDAAEREYRIALNLDSTFAAAEDGLGEVFIERRRFGVALQHAERAAMLEPENAGFLVNYADALIRLERLTEAEEYLAKAIRLDPNLVSGRVNLAYLYHDRGDDQGAYELLKEAVELAPRMTQVQYMFGLAAREVGRSDEAATAFANVLHLEPSAPIAEELTAKLREYATQTGRTPSAYIPPATLHDTPTPRLQLDPDEVWPTRVWPDYTPRTTAEEVFALHAPTPEAILDSAAIWSQRSDQRFLAEDTRRAYGDRALALLDTAAEDIQTLRIRGFTYAVLASISQGVRADSLAALSQTALDAIDTTLVPRGHASLISVGRAYYRLASAYNHMMQYERAIPAYYAAAYLVPDSFTEAISYFFIGTSCDRLGRREEALNAYAISEVHPRNSPRGVRCSRHATVYPFGFMPERN